MKVKELIFKIDNKTFNEALEYLIEKVKKTGEKTFVVTVNTEIVMHAKDDPQYEKVLNSANLALADGIGVIWAGKIFGKKFKERVHGVDLVKSLCKEVAKKPITVGLLGGKGNVAETAANCLREKYPSLKVAFAVEEWPEVLDGRKLKIEDGNLKMEGGRLIDPQSSTLKNLPAGKAGPSSTVNPQSSRNKMSADILFVAFGSPKQEMWIYENLPKIDTKMAIGVGGAFDFISGRVRRAPFWIRNLGLEWLFRLIIQPWRIKRQLKLPLFVFTVLKEKLLG